MARSSITKFAADKPIPATEPMPAPSDQFTGAPWKFGIQTQPIVYPPANKCIYRGAKGAGVKLTREHIVPLSLNGYVIIPRASCCVCQKIIHRYETDCTRNGFFHLRTHLNYSSRHPN